MPKPGVSPGMSDEAVRKGTGKGWEEWIRILDRWGAVEKAHKAIARYLSDELGLDGWWAQTVTVGYERARGLRELGQVKGGFGLDVQRLIAASRTQAYEALTDPKLLSKWFTTRAKVDLRVGGRYSNRDGDEGVFLALAPPRRVRFSWENRNHAPGTVVEINLTPQGGGKVAVRLTHSKLRSKQDREGMKEGWSWAMDSLKSFLETGAPIRHADWVKARQSGGVNSPAPHASRKPKAKPKPPASSGGR